MDQVWPGIHARSLPLQVAHPGEAVSYLGFATSLAEELDQPLFVTGRLPDGLDGTLYINGPGRFERDGRRKRSLLDGDGLITAFTLVAGRARLQARFVRTDKLREEEAAGRFLYSTWTTQRPGGLWRNLGIRFHPRGQAGVSAKRWDERLFAFDEGMQPWELDPVSLDTAGYQTLGLKEGEACHSAHPKVDPVANEWVHFGVQYGARTRVHLTTYGEHMAVRSHRVVPVAGAPYMHDFAVSQRHIVLIRHPTDARPLQFLTGLASVTDSMRWRPERGNQVMVFERGDDTAAPLVLETEAAWLWHTLNAYDRGDETIVELVGFDAPDHFLGPRAALSDVMRGEPAHDSKPGKIRRYVIDRRHRTLRQEILDHGSYEFPFVDPRRVTRQHRFGYFAAAREGKWLPSGVVRMDMETGATQRCDFGADQYSLEPVFAPAPDSPAFTPGAREPGWLLVLVYDGRSRTSRLVVLNAEHVNDGPVAEAGLDRPLPVRFHGTWWPASGA
jgi:all-trans-8'-apo-beta-carotenal 15,15'-oxygenase